MARLDGNNILIVDSAPGVAADYCQVISEFGADCLDATSVIAAREALIERDFDLIVCNFSLCDGKFKDLYRWAQKHLLLMPRFAVLINNPDEEKDLGEYDLSGVLHKSNPGALLHEITKFLFNFNDFLNCIISMSDTSTIHYELKIGEKEVLFRPLEVTDAGMFFSVDEPLSSSQTCFLRIYFFDGVVAKTFTLAGKSEDDSKGLFFRIHPQYRLTWKTVMKKLDQKQFYITSFLKKAAGL